MRAKRWQEAIECFDLVIDGADSNTMANAYCNKAIALKNLGRNDEAIDYYKEAISLNPTDDEIWFNRANCHFILESWNDVITCCNKVVELNPNAGRAWYYLAVAWIRGFRRFDKALECALKAHELGIAEAAPLIRMCEDLQ